MPGDNSLSVNIDDLEAGGAHIKEAGTIAAQILGSVRAAHDKYGRGLGGNGDIGKSFEDNYYDAADDSLDFLDGLSGLVDTHGGKTIQVGNVFRGVNDDTITEANESGSGHRH